MIYTETPNLVIYWDEIVECVHIEWKGFAYGEMFREGLNKGLQLLINRKAHRWLADLRKSRIVNQEDQNWMRYDWSPRSLLAGVRRVAIILPESELAKMSVDAIITKIENSQVETSYFDEVAKAKEWLRAG